MNEGEEIRFIDLFSGIGGFRLGLERANEERRILRQQNMHGHRTDADECLEHGRKAPIGHISQESPRDSEIGLGRANSGLGAKLTAGKGGNQDQKGLSADFGSKDGNGRRKHTDDRVRFTCVWSCDNDKYANQIYTKQFGEEGHCPGDIVGVNPAEIPDFDLLCAGFPCQAFSAAGKRKGFEDTRGTLFFEICRIAEVKRPPLLLLENVKGLLNHDRGRTFTVILQSLDEMGYWVEWQVLNSKHFGVPQNRERVFIVGHLRGTGGREIFPITEVDRYVDGSQEETREKGSRLRDENNILATTIRARTGRNTGDDTYISEIRTAKGDGPIQSVLKNSRIRRLTPVECERLQGFTDGWTEGLSDTQRYKCLGNAVTVNVIEFLGRRIKESIKPTPIGVVQLTKIMEADG